MADDDTRPLGAALTAAREQRGLSVEDVAAATRIRATIIRAIEADDFAACGGAVYARGHLRSVAQVVGADPKPLIAEFDRRFHQPVPAIDPTRTIKHPGATLTVADPEGLARALDAD